MIASGHMLSVVMGEHRLLCAVSSGRSVSTRVLGSAVFDLPAEVTMDQPEALGEALRSFLREQRLSAKSVVVGVPARWVMSREVSLPPVHAAQATAMIRLQAEKLAVSDRDEMIFDYVGQPSTDQASTVLVVAMLRKRLEQITRMTTAAGLDLRGITPTALALAVDLSHADQAAPLLLFGDRAVDVVWRRNGAPQQLVHVPVSLNGHGRSITALSLELTKGRAMVADSPPREAMVCDPVGIAPAEIEQLATAGNLRLQVNPPALLKADSDPHVVTAIALATAVKRRKLPADFAHSRLTVAPARRVGKRSIWAAIIAAIVVLGVGLEVWDHQQSKAELAILESQVEVLKPEFEAAEASIARMAFGRGFYENRPPALDCLRQITLALDDRDALWVTALQFREDGRGQLQGAAGDQRAVLQLVDRLHEAPEFLNVTVLDLREATVARSREYMFSLTFTFRAGD